MLAEGQRRQRRGTDVVVGLVESYGRSVTEAMINGLEVIPRKVSSYRGVIMSKMDLDEVLRSKARGRAGGRARLLGHLRLPGLHRAGA
jgi:two-component system, OmpR family, sensor histidine kinase KdpD